MPQESSPLYRLLQQRHTHAGYQHFTGNMKNLLGKERFEHWRERLRSAEKSTHLPAQERQRMPSLVQTEHPYDTRRKMLVIGRMIPTPDRDSGSLRIFQLLTMIARSDWNVTFVPMDLAYVEGYAESLHQQNISVLYWPEIDSLESFLRTHATEYDCVFLSMLETASRFLPLIRRFAPDVRIIFDTVDLHFVRLERKAALDQNQLSVRQAADCKKEELACIRSADCTIVVSEDERSLLATLEPTASVVVLSNIHDVRPTAAPFSNRSRILFLGNFEHQPNLDAALFLVNDIWPLVRISLPYARLTIAGHHSNECANSLQRDGVDILGHVADLDTVLEETRVCVAPLRYGAGVKGKINMALSHGVPVVTTDIGAEGMHIVDGTHALIANNASSFADAIVRLYTEADLWQKISNSGSALIEEHFSMHMAERQWKHIEQQLSHHQQRILVVIPTGAKDGAMLKHCLESLRHASTGLTLRIIVVLCPATPDRIAAVKNVLPEHAELLTLDPPFSFARSNNAGLNILNDEDAVLMLNDDCFFKGKHDIRKLLEVLQKNKLGCIGPWIRHLAHADEVPYQPRRWFGLERSPLPLIGACLLWDRSWLEKIGYFDEAFAGYGMEEADLLYRLLDAGGRWARYDRVSVDHLHHATVGGDIKQQDAHVRNLQEWKRKYPGVHSWGGSPEWKQNVQRS